MPESLHVPVRYLSSYGFGREQDIPSFDVRPLKSGRGGKVWASMYEASTTGWGDDDELPMVKFFTSRNAAHAHAKQRLHKRLKHNRDLKEDMCGYTSDEEGEGGHKRKNYFPYVTTHALFKGDFPDRRRSKVFGKGRWK